MNRSALALTVVAAIVLTSLIGYVYSPCYVLIVASSNEKFELLDILADRYNATNPRVDRRCVRVQITQVPSGTAERALSEDWKGLRDRPHVWAPAATTWLLLLREERARKNLPDILPPVAQSLFQSPLVIAMPKQMAETLRRSSERLGWHDLVDRARDPSGWARFGKPWGAFRFGQTTPYISTSGLHAMISLNNAAQVEVDPLSFLKVIDATVVHYADSVKTFLGKLYEADAQSRALTYVSAIAVEEKQVFDYNRGNPESRPCGPTAPRLPKLDRCDRDEPHEKLVALYPKEGTFYADHPFAILAWPHQSDADIYKSAADGFRSYLEDKDAQDFFTSQGFRDHLRQAGDVLTDEFFDRAEPRALYTAPLPAVIRETREHWSTKIRKPANAVTLVDVDLPLVQLDNDAVASGLTVVRGSISGALRDLGPDDALGLRTFPTGGVAAYREIVGIERLGTPPSVLSERVDALQPQGGPHALYASIRAAAEDVRAVYSPERVNAIVVISNGTNDTADSRQGLVDWFASQNDRRVLVFAVALTKAAISDLRPIVNASGGVLYDATDAKSVDDAIRKALLNL